MRERAIICASKSRVRISESVFHANGVVGQLDLRRRRRWRETARGSYPLHTYDCKYVKNEVTVCEGYILQMRINRAHVSNTDKLLDGFVEKDGLQRYPRAVPLLALAALLLLDRLLERKAHPRSFLYLSVTTRSQIVFGQQHAEAKWKKERTGIINSLYLARRRAFSFGSSGRTEPRASRRSISLLRRIPRRLRRSTSCV